MELVRVEEVVVEVVREVDVDVDVRVVEEVVLELDDDVELFAVVDVESVDEDELDEDLPLLDDVEEDECSVVEHKRKQLELKSLVIAPTRMPE